MSYKRKRKKSKKQSDKSIAMNIAKGVIIALIVTVAAVLALALIIKEKGADSSVITAINQIIKLISIFIASMLAVKGLDKAHLLTGAAAGFLYIVVGYLIFSFIEGSWGDVLLLITDAATGAVVGALVGLIFGKLLKREKRSET